MALDDRVMNLGRPFTCVDDIPAWEKYNDDVNRSKIDDLLKRVAELEAKLKAKGE